MVLHVIIMAAWPARYKRHVPYGVSCCLTCPRSALSTPLFLFRHPIPLQRRYLDAVPAIVPLLEREQRAAQQQIEATRKDLASLNPDQLKVRGACIDALCWALVQSLLAWSLCKPDERHLTASMVAFAVLQDKGRVFVDAFLNRLQQLLRGTVAAAADKWGETLSDEHARVGKTHAVCCLLLGTRGLHPPCILPALRRQPSSVEGERQTCAYRYLLHAAPAHASTSSQPTRLLSLTAGAFVGSQARTLPVPDTLPNSTMRLYGGAQFHRAMSEFRSVTT